MSDQTHSEESLELLDALEIGMNLTEYEQMLEELLETL